MAYQFNSSDNRYQVRLSQTLNYWLLTANFGHEDPVSDFTKRIEQTVTIIKMTVNPHSREYLLYLRKNDLEKLITELPDIMAGTLC